SLQKRSRTMWPQWLNRKSKTAKPHTRGCSGRPRRRAALLLEPLETRMLLDSGLNRLLVSQVYRDLLGREVEPGGLAFWSGLLDQGVPRFQVVLDIEASLEYQTDLVQEMYQRFLHRDLDPVGQAVFVTALRAGVSQEDVAATIV